MSTADPRPLLRRVAFGTALGLSAAALGVGIGVAYAADQRLADADAALEKAEALLLASESGVSDPKRQKAFDKAVGNALDDIASARAHIASAQAAVDNP